MTRTFVCTLALALSACGGSTPSVTIEMGQTGFTPSTAHVRYGNSVDFVNRDTAAHQVGSKNCSVLNSPMLQTNQHFSVTFGDATFAGKSCDIYDTQSASGASYSGVIVVDSAG
jgi:plastocyanin